MLKFRLFAWRAQREVPRPATVRGAESGCRSVPFPTSAAVPCRLAPWRIAAGHQRPPTCGVCPCGSEAPRPSPRRSTDFIVVFGERVASVFPSFADAGVAVPPRVGVPRAHQQGPRPSVAREALARVRLPCRRCRFGVVDVFAVRRPLRRASGAPDHHGPRVRHAERGVRWRVSRRSANVDTHRHLFPSVHLMFLIE